MILIGSGDLCNEVSLTYETLVPFGDSQGQVNYIRVSNQLDVAWNFSQIW